MRFVENRKLAWVVLIICALGSISLFGGGALISERNDVLTVFSEGTDTSLSTRHSMDAYLGRAAERANVLAEVATRLEANAELIAKVQEGAQAIAAEGELDERHKAYAALTPSVESLYTALQKGYADSALIDARLAYNDYKGAVNLIQNDQYPALASRFNDKLAAFPAKLIGGLFGVEPLNTFGW